MLPESGREGYGSTSGGGEKNSRRLTRLAPPAAPPRGRADGQERRVQHGAQEVHVPRADDDAAEDQSLVVEVAAHESPGAGDVPDPYAQREERQEERRG